MKFKSATSVNEIIRIISTVGTKRYFQEQTGIFLIDLKKGMSVEKAVNKAKTAPEVLVAQPVFLRKVGEKPDPLRYSLAPDTPIYSSSSEEFSSRIPPYMPGEILIQFNQDISKPEIKKLISDYGFIENKQLSANISKQEFFLIKITNGMSVEKALEKLKKENAVTNARPNFKNLDDFQ